jgi:hypothetical protein
MKSVPDALITIAVVITVAVGVVLIVVTKVDHPVRPQSMPYPTSTSTTHATAYDEAATRGGDAAPHENENRGELQPAHLTDKARQRLDAKGAALTPTLEQVRASGAITPDAVTAALIAAGLPAEDVEAVPRTSWADDTQYVVFGIAFEDGCVSGMVTPAQVQAMAMGRIPEWGCIAPDTH